MIKVNNINGSPESVPTDIKIYGIFSDDNNFYFFESLEEYDSFLADIPKPSNEVFEAKPIPEVDVIGLLLSLKPEELQAVKDLLK